MSTRSAGGTVSFVIDRKGILEGPQTKSRNRGLRSSASTVRIPTGLHQAPCGFRVTLIPRLIPESCFHVTRSSVIIARLGTLR